MTINLKRRSAMAFCAEKLFAIPPFQRLQRKVSLFFLEFLKCRLRQRVRHGGWNRWKATNLNPKRCCCGKKWSCEIQDFFKVIFII